MLSILNQCEHFNHPVYQPRNNKCLSNFQQTSSKIINGSSSILWLFLSIKKLEPMTLKMTENWILKT